MGFGPVGFDANMDRRTGAPMALRARIAAYSKPSDKLKALQLYYPDAQPVGDGNFVFTNPETKQPTLFDPKGPDFGDVAEFGRVIPEMVGGAVGGFGGTLLAPGPGTIVGGIAGSQAGGELYDLALRGMTGVPSSRTFGEAAKDVGINAAIDAATLGAGEFAGPAIRKIFGSPQGQVAGQAAPESGHEPAAYWNNLWAWLGHA